MLSRNIPGVGSGRSAKDMVVVALQVLFAATCCCGVRSNIRQEC